MAIIKAGKTISKAAQKRRNNAAATRDSSWYQNTAGGRRLRTDQEHMFAISGETPRHLPNEFSGNKLRGRRMYHRYKMLTYSDVQYERYVGKLPTLRPANQARRSYAFGVDALDSVLVNQNEARKALEAFTNPRADLEASLAILRSQVEASAPRSLVKKPLSHYVKKEERKETLRRQYHAENKRQRSLPPSQRTKS